MPQHTAEPKNLIFEITQRCNANCMYCYNVWKKDASYPKGELSAWRLKRLLEKVIRGSGARRVTLSGGEPLLRKDLESIVALLRKLNVEVNIITNATLLNECRIKKLISSGVSVFEVPLLSGRRQTHNKLMRFESFDLITEAIVKIKKYRGKVVTVFVATRENIECFEEAARLSFALGADGVMFNRFNPGGEGAKYMTQLLPSSYQLAQALKIADDFSKEYDMPVSSSIPVQPCVIDTAQFKKISFGFCAAGTEKSYYNIDSMGNLRICNHSRMILGNLFREQFADLISKKNVFDFVSSVPGYCVSCGRRASCLGGCKAAAEVCFGSTETEEPFLRLNKPSAENSLQKQEDCK